MDQIYKFKVVENFYKVVGENSVAELEKRDSLYLSLLVKVSPQTPIFICLLYLKGALQYNRHFAPIREIQIRFTVILDFYHVTRVRIFLTEKC